MTQPDTTDALGHLTAAMLREEMIMRALDDCYQRGEMEYLHYSPARDATAARAAALSFAIRLSPVVGEDGERGSSK
jgi:hypothetical protein